MCSVHGEFDGGACSRRLSAPHMHGDERACCRFRSGAVNLACWAHGLGQSRRHSGEDWGVRLACSFLERVREYGNIECAAREVEDLLEMLARDLAEIERQVP